MNNTFSKIGFILAVAGSAVGLGNAWKFPTMVGTNGGSAFVMLFILLTLGVGFVIFLCELYIGKASRLDPASAYYFLAPKYKKPWSLVGFTMIGALLIVSFYSVIIGWIIYYIYYSLSTIFNINTLSTQIADNKELFINLVETNLSALIICFSIVFFIAFYTVAKGVKNGIEKLNVFMMPTLFIMLLLMLCYSFTQDGFKDAFNFLFMPDFSKINQDSFLDALGLACFSLSIGAGSIITYSASLPERTNFVSSTFYIIFINLLIGLMMGLIVFSFIFEFNADPSAQGPGLIFISLISLFAKLGLLGKILAVTFFIALFFAGITSAVSMIEPFVFYLINKFNFSRIKAIVLIGVVVYILGLLCIFSGIEAYKNNLTFFGMNFFDILDNVSSNIIMPFGSFMAAIFVGFFISKQDLKETFIPYMGELGFKIWIFFARFVAPLAVLVIVYFKFKG
ncbi:sodium-dependent transporter [Campylobacter sp. RM12642]|uniref:sodium-dependent transporter n=1 Tax=unclassified Campylobacter TaxID=2593542 RepID=UPI001BDA5351|nr:sodium-dependent transporter [Campylobacter sp. 2018MI13]MBT0883319.1 sodium-dependent transporter [Campylobacter sp. 2018MI13]MBZ7980398.1 sodium-dependent transporter [Campylobacter sp. RM12642]MBZ8008360.1 sodium-dependent transporter [Campylobacter sp. RM9334]